MEFSFSLLNVTIKREAGEVRERNSSNGPNTADWISAISSAIQAIVAVLTSIFTRR